MSTPIRTGIPRLLGTTSVSEFLQETWEQSVRLVRHALADAAAGILTLDQLEFLIASAAGAGCGVSIVEGGVARPIERAGDRSGLEVAREAYRRGCTLLVAGLQTRWGPIAAICREIENDLLASGVPLSEGVGANAYLTPAGAQGFDIHYDNHCAVVLQLSGRKHWTVFPALEELPLARCEHRIPIECLQPPVLETDLSAGDVLYIPRGLPHFAAAAVDESSLHVTLSLRTATWVDLIEAVCRDAPELRRSIGRGGPVPERMAAVAEQVTQALARCDAAAWVEERRADALSRLAPEPTGGLSAIDGAAAISRETRLKRTARMMCSVSEVAGQAVLRFPGAELSLPLAMKPVFEFIAGHQELAASELPEVDARYDALHLTKILIRRGLLRSVEMEVA